MHTRVDNNEIFYIGIGTKTKEDIKYNTYNRARSKSQRNRFWYNIYNKTLFNTKILFDNITKDESKRKEIRLIKLIGRRNLNLGTLVNLTDGGDGMVSYKISDITKEKMRINGLGRKLSEKTKNKIKETRSTRVYKYPDSLREIHGKRVVQLTKDLKFVNEFYLLIDAAKYINRNYTNICYCCKNINKNCGGFKWMYKEDYLNYLIKNNV